MEAPDHDNQPGYKLGTLMVHLSWIAVLVLISVLAQGWLDKRQNPNRQPVVETGNDGRQQLILQRNPYGHYVASGRVNGYEVQFLLDTGATDVVIPEALAKRLDLAYGFAGQARTANGVITVYATELEQVTLGPLQLHNVRASINPNMDDDEILLGMSFLKHLHLTQYQDKLILSQGFQ